MGQVPAEAFITPAAAVRAIMDMVDSEASPLRFAVGIQAENDMRAALTARLQDLDGWAEVTRTANS